MATYRHFLPLLLSLPAVISGAADDAVFNAIRAPKEILTDPLNGHGYYTAESYARLWKYLAEVKRSN